MENRRRTSNDPATLHTYIPYRLADFLSKEAIRLGETFNNLTGEYTSHGVNQFQIRALHENGEKILTELKLKMRSWGGSLEELIMNINLGTHVILRCEAKEAKLTPAEFSSLMLLFGMDNANSSR